MENLTVSLNATPSANGVKYTVIPESEVTTLGSIVNGIINGTNNSADPNSIWVQDCHVVDIPTAATMMKRE